MCNEARKTLGECRAAVPVWIMPLSRVIESFDIATTRFDVVIIDEASQSDVLGLVALNGSRSSDKAPINKSAIDAREYAPAQR